jgi:hypothetical protein
MPGFRCIRKYNRRITSISIQNRFHFDGFYPPKAGFLFDSKIVQDATRIWAPLNRFIFWSSLRTPAQINLPIRIPSSGHLRLDPIPRNPRNSAAIPLVSRNRLKPNLTRIRARTWQVNLRRGPNRQATLPLAAIRCRACLWFDRSLV